MKTGDVGKFKELTRAYVVLSDSNSRKRYDETGEVEQRVAMGRVESMIASMVAEAFSQDKEDPIRWMQRNLAKMSLQQQRIAEDAKSLRDAIESRRLSFERYNVNKTDTTAYAVIMATLQSGVENANRTYLDASDKSGFYSECGEFLNGLKCPVTSYQAYSGSGCVMYFSVNG